MGIICCSEMNGDHGLDFDFMGFLTALVIALVLMAICTPPPRRAMRFVALFETVLPFATLARFLVV